jgi:GNAT superfamily N-acetyltransferase
VSSTIVRLSAKNDLESLLKMPPYSRSGVACPFREDILVAESEAKVVGAVSISYKEISYVPGEWKNTYEQHPNNLEKILGCWVSKLYVLPEHRSRGVGTKLVEESLKYVNAKGFNEAYAGIYVKNKFRKVSQRIFEKNGFKKFGSCICFLSEGYCRGTLLKKIIKSSHEGE